MNGRQKQMSMNLHLFGFSDSLWDDNQLQNLFLKIFKACDQVVKAAFSLASYFHGTSLLAVQPYVT